MMMMKRERGRREGRSKLENRMERYIDRSTEGQKRRRVEDDVMIEKG